MKYRVIGILLLSYLPAALAAQDGVVLYRDINYRGTSEVFTADDPDLRDNRIGNDRASSVRLPRGFVAILYEDTNYRGRSITLTSDEANLGNTALGNDRVSSIRVERRQERRRRPWWQEPEPREDRQGREGVTLYADSSFRGLSEVFTADDPDLRDNPIRNDRASSIKVPPGYAVTLYEGTGYRGRSVTLTHDVPHLADTALGNDQASSLRVEWRGRGRGRREDRRERRSEDRSGDRSRGITLYADSNFRGSSEVFTSDDPDLRDNLIRNDRASSVRVPAGCAVVLFEDVNYRGRSVRLTRDESFLGNTTLGNDQVSSLRVEIEGQGRQSPSDQEGVTLYVDSDYRGRSEVFTRSDPDLRDNAIGNDRVSSIRIPSGYVVTLYADINYRGRSVRLIADTPFLGRTALGNDRVSSIRVERRRIRQ